MRRQLKTFAGTCHRCREVGHKAHDCRRSVDLPKCSANEAATTTDGRTKTWGHDPCYNPEEKLSRGSRRESVAIERPTNAIEHVADVQEINLLREVSDEEEKDPPNAPDGPRELRDEPQELQNLPIVGESRDSKRQAAEANTAAEGTGGSAEVIRKVAVVEGKALPGSKLAKRASRADETPDGRQPQAQQVKLHHKRSQHNENAKRNIPSAHGVPLEGEWSVCASGRVMSDSHKDGMGEHGCVDEWCWPVEKSKPTVRIPKGYCQLGRADVMSCKEMSADGQDKSAKLVPTTVELDDSGGGETPCVCLGGTKMQIGEVESHGCRADKSRGQANKSNGWANRSRGQPDASTVLNTCETVATGDGDGRGARSDAGDARHGSTGPDGHANRSDMSNGHRDVPDTGNGMNTTADTKETISTRRNVPQMQDSPIRARRRDKVEPRSCTGMPNMRRWCCNTREYGWKHAETRQYMASRPETARLTYWEHKVVPR